MKIEIKDRYENNVLFSYECENNTVLKTLLEAIENGADLSEVGLSFANLSGADLRSANLHRADLRGANLSGAGLRDADLRRADLRDADLSFANLSFADLIGANLSFANLSFADLRGADLRDANLISSDLRDADLPMYCKWSFSIINQEIIKIGCKEKTISEWVEWFENSDEVFETSRDTNDFKKIRAMFYAHKAYLENL
jgi:hypothetical protein